MRTRIVPLLLVSAAILGVLFPTSARAATATIPDYATDPNRITIDDNTLYQPIPPSYAVTSNGAGSYFFTGKTKDGYLHRAAIRFDVAAYVPAGSTITAAQLTLNCSRVSDNTARLTKLHRLLSSWGEGTSNADKQEGKGVAPTTNDATWYHRFYSATLWTGAVGTDPNTGGARFDYNATSSAETSVGAMGTYTWGSTAAMVSDAQAWLNTPASNYGWILIGVESATSTSKRFDSSEATTGARPVLTVTYTPPAPTGGCCFGGGVCSILTQTSCTSGGGTYLGDATTCSPNPCSQPTGGCCAASGTCSIATQTDCSTQGGVYEGTGTTCSPNPCPQPTAACCDVSGVCSTVTQADCLAQGDTWQGVGTTCSPNPCPQPTGACCASDTTCSAQTQGACLAAGGSYRGDFTNCATESCPLVLTPFVDPLPIPGVAVPISGSPGGVATYDMPMTELNQQLHRDLPPTRVWGFAGGYPGPTIEASVGQPVTVNWINDLRDPLGNLRTQHYLPVDLCMEGPDTAGPTPRTVVHLHGGHVPESADGYPEATFLPGQQATYVYPNNQGAATLWYHDHAMGITRLNVYMGLAGFYLLRDPAEASLNLPSGAYEIPMAIQDRIFNPDGTLSYPPNWEEHFFGDKVLVNGKVWPYLNVKRGKYRFRLLNGSGSRTYTLSFSNPTVVFHLIGLEGGLMPAPLTVSSLTIGPGERRDVVVDFAVLPAGSEVVMINSAPIMFPGTPGDGVIPNVMKFVVGNQSGYTAALPGTLKTLDRIPASESRLTRQFELRKSAEPCAGSMWTINGLTWGDITEYPEVGTTETWEFVNRSGVMHPMHMHLVMFQVLNRQTFDVINNQIVPTGSPVAPLPEENGWKDTVQTPPNQITRVITRFEDFAGRYPYHCHILEHEDHEMMRQFQTIKCGNGVVEPTERCDDGNTVNGDLCSSRCRWEEYLMLTGSGQGGSATILVEGVTIGVTTTAGETTQQIAAALAAAINADPTLAAMGVTASASSGRLLVGGVISNVIISDPGVTEQLTLSIGGSYMWWSSVGDRIGYDVVRGNLGTLRSSHGDFTTSTTGCVAYDMAATSMAYGANPPLGQGYWFLVRKVGSGGPGTYDEGSTSQVGLRDAEIAASPGACP